MRGQFKGKGLIAATISFVLLFKLFRYREREREREKGEKVSSEGLKQDSAVK